MDSGDSGDRCPDRLPVEARVLRSLIILVQICKAPTPQLKALNKQNTHNVFKIENVISNLIKAYTERIIIDN